MIANEHNHKFKKKLLFFSKLRTINFVIGNDRQAYELKKEPTFDSLSELSFNVHCTLYVYALIQTLNLRKRLVCFFLVFHSVFAKNERYGLFHR